MTTVQSAEDVLAQITRSTEAPQDEMIPAATTIHLDCEDMRGIPYKHSFYYKVPNLGERLQIGRVKQNYMPDGVPPDVMSANLVHMISYLTVTIQFNEQFKKPKWWNFWDLYDSTPFQALFEEVTQHEARFLGADRSDRGVQDADSGSDAPEPGAGEAPMVGGVQAPAERRETLSSNAE